MFYRDRTAHGNYCTLCFCFFKGQDWIISGGKNSRSEKLSLVSGTWTCGLTLHSLNNGPINHTQTVNNCTKNFHLKFSSCPWLSSRRIHYAHRLREVEHRPLLDAHTLQRETQEQLLRHLQKLNFVSNEVQGVSPPFIVLHVRMPNARCCQAPPTHRRTEDKRAGWESGWSLGTRLQKNAFQ